MLRSKLDCFYCPHCKIYTKQEWHNIAKGHLSDTGVGYYEGFLPELFISSCSICGEYALWHNDKMIYPASSIAPMPLEGMPAEVKEIFMEARKTANVSPRAATALLRLALQKLMIHLGGIGKDLDYDVANLAKKGLPKRVTKALEAFHVIGNEAVHPGMISERDNIDTSVALFDLLNIIVDVTVLHPKKFNEIYGKINSAKRPKKKPRMRTRKQRKPKKYEPIQKPTILYR